MNFFNALITSFILIVVVFLDSCKKDDTDKLKPLINASAPYDNQNLQFGDNILVKASISDETKLTYVKWSLTSYNNIQIDSKVYEVSGKQKELEDVIYITDPTLESGIYFISITASDGINETKRIVEVNISQIPKERKGIYVITQEGMHATLHLYYSGFIQKVMINVLFKEGAINSKDQQYCFLGEKNQEVYAIDLQNYSTAWTVSTGSFYPYESLSSYNSTTYLSKTDGIIYGYSSSGTVVKNIVVPNGFYPNNVIENGEYVIAELRSLSGSTFKLTSFFSSSGASYKEVSISDSILAFYRRNDSEIAVFLRNGNQGNLNFFNAETNNLYNYQTLPAGKLKGTAAINEDFFVFSIDNVIYRYQLSTNNLVPLISAAADHIKYDDVNDELIIASGNQLKIYDYSTKVFKASAIANSEIKEINLLYNR